MFSHSSTTSPSLSDHNFIIKMISSKKFAVAAAVLLAGTQSVEAKSFASPLGGINALLDFRVEVDAASACDAANSNYSVGSITRGSASVYPSLLKKIEKAIGHGTIHPAVLDEAVHQVQTKRFMETSPLHRDFYTDEQGVGHSAGGENGMVGFIFANTNEDAHFETNDGSLCFPVVEGTFMSFDGNIPHRTVVKSGHVELIGPFLLPSSKVASSYQARLFGVGYQCPTVCCAIGNTLCIIECSLPVCAKTSKSPTAKSSKAPKGSSITSSNLASNQATKSPISILIAGTMIVAAAAVLNMAWKWAQKRRQPRSINDLEEEEDVDGVKDDFEDEPSEQYSRNVIIREGNIEIVDVEAH